MSTKSLLVELFVEELPPKALERLGHEFARVLAASLQEQGLATDDAVVTPFATPRRLAVHVTAVSTQAPERAVEQKLVPVAIGLDADGNATPVLLKKLAAVGADAGAVAKLRTASDGKKDTLWLDTVEPGADLATGLQTALDAALQQLPIPKVMTYQEGDGWTNVKFVRPAHRLVALHGAEVVAVTALSLQAGRTTQGHRFATDKQIIELQDADSYEAQLREAAVIASFATRRGEIERQLRECAAAVKLVAIDDADLLDEVTGLVELPNVLICSFEAEFLAVPQECLILTMKQNQKYFPLLDGDGKLSNRFLIVSNITPDDPSAVIDGNERVVRPRLSDARFFFDQDQKKTLTDRLPGLGDVVYHNQLGSQGLRVERVRDIARAIGERLGGAELVAAADRGALLAKTDLLTEMVGEFPELQGIMGGYYARHDGEGDDVAIAIEDHYKPRYAGDELPRNDAGVCVALADKLETLVGMFGIGQTPTGDKDPFALRRHALGVIRMLVERELPLQLDELIAIGTRVFDDGVITDPKAALSDFVYDRLTGVLRDAGYTTREVAAVVSRRPPRLAEVGPRLAAVRAFAQLPEAEALAAADKRIGNILRKSEVTEAADLDDELLQEDSERALAAALRESRQRTDPMFERGDYEAALRDFAALRAPVDAFFDSVMVNAEDDALRRNRLALLAGLHALMNRVADLSQLA